MKGIVVQLEETRSFPTLGPGAPRMESTFHYFKNILLAYIILVV
jgi:hypothetical protein